VNGTSAGSGSWLPEVPGYEKLRRAGEMGEMGVKVVRTTFVPPMWWIPECARQTADALRRCWLPAALSMAALSIGVAVDFVGGIIKSIGTADRIGGGLGVGYVRDPGVWITVMTLAGVAGAQMTADLGARKIRDELDALSVLGVEEMRGLILPRVIALAIAAPILSCFTNLVGWVVSYLVTPVAFHQNVLTKTAFLETFKSFISAPDLPFLVVKLICAGFFVGLVSCYKGVRSSGGAEGVGRAVNEAVLLSFIGVWMINILFNTMFFALFPSATALRG
jgi:phospholipid/cholesterol/gamma-HCH transport system permease protein